MKDSITLKNHQNTEEDVAKKFIFYKKALLNLKNILV